MILVTANEMQQMDRGTIESFGLPGRVLMENGGRGATRFFHGPPWHGKGVPFETEGPSCVLQVWSRHP